LEIQLDGRRRSPVSANRHVERGERDETRRMGKVGLRTREPSIMHVPRPRCDRQINSTEKWRNKKAMEKREGARFVRFAFRFLDSLFETAKAPKYEEIFLSDPGNRRARRPFCDCRFNRGNFLFGFTAREFRISFRI